MTQYLAAGGRHTFEYQIDGIRPGDSSGYGYWRASSYLTGYAADAGPADFDYDGVVDGDDFLAWQRGYGLSGQVNNGSGDADHNGSVETRDLGVWRTAFGASAATPMLANVPEPASLGLGIFAIAATLAWRSNRSSQR